ncbi:MAG: hypothetical protein ABR575_04415 [Actinomycetota bacterium]
MSLIELGVGLYFLVGAFVVLGGFVMFLIEATRSRSTTPQRSRARPTDRQRLHREPVDQR